MKKLMAFLLTVALLFSVTACGLMVVTADSVSKASESRQMKYPDSDDYSDLAAWRVDLDRWQAEQKALSDTTKEAVKGLKSAAGYMRRELGYALSLRHTPELRFVADDSIEYSAGIAATINRIRKEENA